MTHGAEAVNGIRGKVIFHFAFPYVSPPQTPHFPSLLPFIDTCMEHS